MIVEELIAMVRDETERVLGHEFTGTLRVEIHCNKGTIRRAVLIEEPEKLTFEHYRGKPK